MRFPTEKQRLNKALVNRSFFESIILDLVYSPIVNYKALYLTLERLGYYALFFTAICARPFRRLAWSTLVPAFVAVRTKKP